MRRYRFEGADKEGIRQTGVVQAIDESHAARVIQKKGLTVISIQFEKEPVKLPSFDFAVPLQSVLAVIFIVFGVLWLVGDFVAPPPQPVSDTEYLDLEVKGTLMGESSESVLVLFMPDIPIRHERN